VPHDEESEVAADDLTPTVGAATDIAPLGHIGIKPAHELTAGEDSNPVDWRRVTQMPEFHQMLKAKRRFIVPATLFFVVYYFALPVLVGYAPVLMSKKVFGVVNIAYLFALSQFFMAWVIAALYVRAASRFDKMERGIVEIANFRFAIADSTMRSTTSNKQSQIDNRKS
jgi:uncharacterized membrane protein (DUF485 family)